MIHIVDEMRVLVQRRMHQASQIIQNSSRDKASYESYKELEKSILRDFDYIVQNGVPYVALIKSSEKLAIFLTLTSDMESGSFPWSYDKILYARFTGAWKLSTALDVRLQEDGVIGLLIPTAKELVA